jgi:hypothetical protein
MIDDTGSFIKFRFSENGNDEKEEP